MAPQDDLLLKVGLKLDDVIADFRKLNTSVGKVDDKLKKASKDWQKSFAKFGLAINGLQQGFNILNRTIGVGVRDIAKFQTEMVRVNTIINLTTANFNRMTKAVINLSKDIPQTVEQLSQGLFQVVSAGVEASKAMDFLTVSAKAATAGFTNTEISVDAITSVINAFGKEVDEAEQVADVFFTTIRLGKTELDLLSPTLGQFVPQAAAAGISFEEVSAAMATLTKSAIPTARAATGIGRAITEMVKPASKAEKAIIDLGFATGQAGIDALGFQGTVKELVDNGANLIEIFGDEAARAVLTLGNNYELAASDLDQMTKAAGAMDTAFSMANETLENQGVLLQNELKAIYLNFSDVLIPGWTTALKWLRAALDDTTEATRAMAEAGDDELSQLEARKKALTILEKQFVATGQSRQKQGQFYRDNKEALSDLGFGMKNFGELQVTMNAALAENFELTGKIAEAKKREEEALAKVTKQKEDEADADTGSEMMARLERTRKFRLEIHLSRLEQVEKEKKAIESLAKAQQRLTDAYIRNGLQEIDEDDRKVDRRFELGRLSTWQYIQELKMRRDAEEENSLARLELEGDIERLTIERFERLSDGWKEFLKGEAIDWITAKQIEMLATLGAIWAKGGLSSGLTLAPDLARYGTGVAFLEGAKQLVTAFAEGGKPDGPTLALVGDVPEFIAPEKKFEQYSRETLTPMIQAQVEAKLIKDGGTGLLSSGLGDIKKAVEELTAIASSPMSVINGHQIRIVNARINRGSLARS